MVLRGSQSRFIEIHWSEQVLYDFFLLLHDLLFAGSSFNSSHTTGVPSSIGIEISPVLPSRVNLDVST